MPEDFQLHDIDIHFDTFRRAYPKNKNIDAKVRQTLQLLRDRGDVGFLGNGRYKRLVPRPESTTIIDFACAAHLTSASQRARVALETWANLNLWCYRCGNPTLLALPPNAPVSDLLCPVCRFEYQVKSKNGRFGAAIVGAAFEPLIERLRSHSIPDYLLIEYEADRSQVMLLNAIPGAAITPDRIAPRKPLSSTARRAGWKGCTIHIEGLPTTEIVGPRFVLRP
ncbi:MAG: DpnI domain-containing protein [Vulcanimicrobiaceae bacterium]